MRIVNNMCNIIIITMIIIFTLLCYYNYEVLMRIKCRKILNSLESKPYIIKAMDVYIYDYTFAKYIYSVYVNIIINTLMY